LGRSPAEISARIRVAVKTAMREIGIVHSTDGTIVVDEKGESS
jgi:hypothetical protein